MEKKPAIGAKVKKPDDHANLLKLSVIDAKLRCEFCDFEFMNVTNLFVHEASHDPSNGFECSYCQISVPTTKAMLLHWNTECPFELHETDHQINVKTLFACNVCESKFGSLDELYEHRYSLPAPSLKSVRMNNINRFVSNSNHRYSACHLFPRWNVTAAALQVGCEKCGENFSTATALVSHHEEIHSKGIKRVETCRPYLCEICGKGYTQSSQLYQHQRFHQGTCALYFAHMCIERR